MTPEEIEALSEEVARESYKINLTSRGVPVQSVTLMWEAREPDIRELYTNHARSVIVALHNLGYQITKV